MKLFIVFIIILFILYLFFKRKQNKDEDFTYTQFIESTPETFYLMTVNQYSFPSFQKKFSLLIHLYIQVQKTGKIQLNNLLSNFIKNILILLSFQLNLLQLYLVFNNFNLIYLKMFITGLFYHLLLIKNLLFLLHINFIHMKIETFQNRFI